MNRKTFLVLVMCILSLHYVMAEDSKKDEANDMELIELQGHVLDCIDDMSSIAPRVSSAQLSQLKLLERIAQQQDRKWQIWYEANKDVIAKDDSVISLVTAYEETREMLMESIQMRHKVINSMVVFRKSEASILHNDTVYTRMLKEAKMLALSPSTDQVLSKLKTKEKLILQEVDSCYLQAKDAASVNPRLKQRMRVIEEKYVEIKTSSETIQATTYQSFLQRWKDQLIGLAIVTFLLGVIAYLGVRLKAAKAAKDAQKKVDEMMKKQEEDYPEI